MHIARGSIEKLIEATNENHVRQIASTWKKKSKQAVAKTTTGKCGATEKGRKN